MSGLGFRGVDTQVERALHSLVLHTCIYSRSGAQEDTNQALPYRLLRKNFLRNKSVC
jgi:hypothetical protein